MNAVATSLLSTWMCFGCGADPPSLKSPDPVSVIVADQKTAALRISDAFQDMRRRKMHSLGQLIAFRVLEDENFARRADNLAHRMAQRLDAFGNAPEIVRAATGADFLDELVSASRRGPIGNLVIYGHAGASSLYMMEDRGFYRSVSEVAASTQVPLEPGLGKEQALRKLGARDLRDLEALVRSGDIRFAADAVIVFTGCAAAGERAIDPTGIAARFAEIADATVIASLGVTDQSMAGRHISPDEFSRGTWVRFVKGAQPQKLGTRVLDPLNALRADDGAPVVHHPVERELLPSMPGLPQYWCAALPNDMACDLRATAHAVADAR